MKRNLVGERRTVENVDGYFAESRHYSEGLREYAIRLREIEGDDYEGSSAVCRHFVGGRGETLRHRTAPAEVVQTQRSA